MVFFFVQLSAKRSFSKAWTPKAWTPKAFFPSLIWRRWGLGSLTIQYALLTMRDGVVPVLYS